MLRTPQYKLCAAAVALSAPAVLLFSPEIFKIAAERGLPESAAPYSIVLGSAASAAGRMLLPAVSDKLGRKPVLYAVYIGLAAGSAWFAFAEAVVAVGGLRLLTFFLPAARRCSRPSTPIFSGWRTQVSTTASSRLA